MNAEIRALVARLNAVEPWDASDHEAKNVRLMHEAAQVIALLCDDAADLYAKIKVPETINLPAAND